MASIIYQRIKELCMENRISINRLETETGMSRSSIEKWKNDGAYPTVNKLSKIAQYFHVSMDYLIGATDIRELTGDIINDQDIISLQRARENMSPEERERMMQVVQAAFSHAFHDTEKYGSTGK